MVLGKLSFYDTSGFVLSFDHQQLPAAHHINVSAPGTKTDIFSLAYNYNLEASKLSLVQARKIKLDWRGKLEEKKNWFFINCKLPGPDPKKAIYDVNLRFARSKFCNGLKIGMLK